MITPIRPLHSTLASAIHLLGVNHSESLFPRVVLEQFELRPTRIVKDAETFEATFLVDVITQSDSPVESLDLLERVQEIITEDKITVEGYTIQELSPEALTPLYEPEDAVWRQLQRYRIKLIKNK